MPRQEFLDSCYRNNHMPRKTKPSNKRSMPARRGRKAARRAVKKVGEWAEAKQTLQLTDDPMNIILQLNQIRLAQFNRLSQIAQSYQFFRFVRAEIRFKPYSDTYIPGLGTAPGQVTPSVPYLFYLIDKGNNLEIADFKSLRDAGAVPHRFDDKTIVVTWKPGVIYMTQDFQNQNPPATSVPKPASTKLSPWLATSANAGERGGAWFPSEVDHSGLLYGCEQNAVVPNIAYKYGVELTIHAQFKKPLNFPSDNTINLVQHKDVVSQ